MPEIDKVLEQYLHGTDGRRLSEVHLYGTVGDLVAARRDPAFAGTLIVPHFPLDERNGEIRTHLPHK